MLFLLLSFDSDSPTYKRLGLLSHSALNKLSDSLIIRIIDHFQSLA